MARFAGQHLLLNLRGKSCVAQITAVLVSAGLSVLACQVKCHKAMQQHGSVDIKSLTATFPWEKFLAQTMSWVQMRAAEQIDEEGGVNAIQQNLQEKANGSRTPKPKRRTPMSSEKQVENLKKLSPVCRSALSAGGPRQAKATRKSLGDEARRLMQLKAQMAQEPLAGEVVEDARAQLEADHEEMPPLGGDMELPPSSALEDLLRDKSVNKEVVLKVYTTVEKQVRQSNKENIDNTSRPKGTFIDRQNDAKRLSFNDDSQEVPSDTPRHHLSPGKRRHGDEDEDDDDDDDFEAINAGAADRRRKELRDKTGPRTSTTGSLSKRPRSEVPESLHSVLRTNDRADYDPVNKEAAVNQQLANAVAGSSSARASQRLPPSTQPVRPPLESSHNTNTLPSSSAPARTARQLEYVRLRARETVMTAKKRRVQSRCAYTQEEEERLIDLIEECGISYSLLKQMDVQHPDGSLLEERTQVQLKDKAQELKFQFLK